jgi:hypothetical protein
MPSKLRLQRLHRAQHPAQILLNGRGLPSAMASDRALVEGVLARETIVVPDQNAMNGSLNITRTGTLSTRSGNCALAELVLST